LNPNGGFTYTPNPGFVGTDSFTYQATDGMLPSNTATVTIVVTNAPPAAQADVYSVGAGATFTIPAPGVLANDIDPESGPLTAVVATNPGKGSLTLQPNGSFSYTSNPGFAGSDTFTYRASDGTTVSNDATVTIVVTNTAPVAQADVYPITAGATLTVPGPGVLANDVDPDAGLLTAAIVSNTGKGSVSLNANGGFSYTPNAGFAGLDTFTYRASDGIATSNDATVTIVVTLTQCTTRPNVRIVQTPTGGKLNVHVETTPLNDLSPNPLREVRFGTFQNARVTLNGQAVTSGQIYTVPANGVAVDFAVERLSPGQATTVPFTVIDGCGVWPTFVGGGTSAGF